jgi:hypothetical protein
MAALEASARAVPARAEAEPPSWQIWTALWIVYIVWGSTYLGIALMVETMPPLLAAGTRFIAVGLILLPILAWRKGLSVLKPTRAELLSAAFVGLMLPGANAVISVAQQTVPSGLAALLVASIPLWVILLRKSTGERISWQSLGAVLVGFGGLVLLLKPEPAMAAQAAAAWVGQEDATPPALRGRLMALTEKMPRVSTTGEGKREAAWQGVTVSLSQDAKGNWVAEQISVEK